MKIAHLGEYMEHAWLWMTCPLVGHRWDSERPKGPLGYDPDRCWRCLRTRPADAPKRPHRCRDCRKVQR